MWVGIMVLVYWVRCVGMGLDRNVTCKGVGAVD